MSTRTPRLGPLYSIHNNRLHSQPMGEMTGLHTTKSALACRDAKVASPNPTRIPAVNSLNPDSSEFTLLRTSKRQIYMTEEGSRGSIPSWLFEYHLEDTISCRVLSRQIRHPRTIPCMLAATPASLSILVLPVVQYQIPRNHLSHDRVTQLHKTCHLTLLVASSTNQCTAMECAQEPSCKN
jgi:hypothetical protein